MNLLKENSYHVLGLDTSASQKEVSKRSKEILTRLKIDDVPEYDTDAKLFNGFRTEDLVKEAVSNLSSPKKHIREYFFWFLVSDEIDEEALKSLRSGDYEGTAKKWEEYISEDSGKSLLYKKNLAILYSLLLYKEKNEEYLSRSIALWSELVESSKFWNAFSKVYKLHEELGAQQEVIDEFKRNVANDISDIYADLAAFYKDNHFIAVFSKNFGLKGEKIETDVLTPIYKIINDAVEELENLKVSDDGVLDQHEIAEIKRLIKIIQAELNKLIDLGLYEESKIKVVRDRAAATLRRLSIEVHNNLSETNIALGLSKIADRISGTESFKSKVQQDIKTLQENKEHKEKEERQRSVVDPIIADFHAGKVDRAIQVINQHIYSDGIDEELKQTLIEIKRAIEERIVKSGKPVGRAPALWSWWGFGTTIYGDTVYVTLLFIPVFALGRYNVTSEGWGSYTFHGKLSLHTWQKIFNFVAPPIAIIFIMLLGSE